MDTRVLLARRLIAQGLAPSAARPAFATPTAAAAGLLAVQGQTYPAGIRALSLRSGTPDEDVLEAVRTLTIVRSWPQRGTLHFLAAEDARWLARLLHPRVAPSQIARRPGLQLDDATVARAHEALVAALLDAGTLTRKEAYTAFAETGVDPAGGRGPHLMRFFGGQGDIVQGPKAGAQETFLLVDSLPVRQRELDGEEALRELGRRYALGHGPVSVADLSWWSMLTKAQAKRAFSLNPELIEVDGYFMAPWQADVTAAEIAAALQLRLELPAFDEYLLGYTQKELVLSDELRKDVLTSNGLSWPWVMEGGVCVASLRAT